MTDGERIALRSVARDHDLPMRSIREYPRVYSEGLAKDIDSLVRRRMAEAWDQGHECGVNDMDLDTNPYRGRKRKA